MPNKASTSADSSKSAGTLSCVIPAYNEADNLARLLPMLHDELDRTGMAWEIIVVNDGSRDHTFDTLASLSEQIRGVRAVHFSRNFGKEAAITAGIDMAHGDAVIIMDADLQHSPSLIPVMLQHWREGAEVVYAIRSHREDEKPLKQIGTRLFYRAVNRGARFGIPPDAGDFRLMDRKVVLALRRLPERNRFMKGLYAWAGFRTVAIPYQPLTRESGLSHFNAIKLLHFAIDGMTAFTTWPLRVVTLIGLLAAVVAFLYGSWVVLSYFIWGNHVSGWSTLIVCILLFSGLQMMSLGVMGEYIARIFEEVKRRPVYIVSEEHGSGLPRKRRNTLYPLSGGANTVHPDLPDPLPDDVTLQ
ncbi:glycosyltransferase family 2 protein [Brachymonas denitrificans]|uniref:glycosyltransferase family 2 protein n=1 Tax=Brachymonas denitrificans TaxID=28220 RepID=UPI00352EC63E